ncbi:hypothetical protein [Tannerella forsythia]|uniref:Lipoprotein n=1 Tax=Tannerella forsythia TaxID=28112 RepID=A0A3P1XP08_TANFO|nr:hypothetical protein [Tannerella forsythia]RRD59750.1 hypothetical protein EII40_08910 [Tannerella forsythia]
MKAKDLLGLVCLLAVIGLSGCGSDEFAERNAYENSRSQWADLKKAKGNSYVYRVSRSSWTGWSSYTDIQVENGAVTARRFYEVTPLQHADGSFRYKKEGGFLCDTTCVYTESVNDIGTHEQGDKPLTMDELYEVYGKYLMVDRKQNTLYFKTDTQGILKLCGYFPNTCADDCFRGIHIESFRWLKK